VFQSEKLLHKVLK